MIRIMFVKWTLLIIFFVISCPRPGIIKIPEPDYLKEAKSHYQQQPLYAHALLKDSVISIEHMQERALILSRIYIDQREYERAAAILDSVAWAVDLTPYESDIILLKTKRWAMLAQTTEDSLLKGISYYHLGEHDKAIECLTKPIKPDDYRLLYLAKVYHESNSFENAFGVITSIDSVSSYLHHDFQNILFELFLNIEDTRIVQKELPKLDNPSLQEFILLKIYEKQKDRNNQQKTAWKLITKYPASTGALYATGLVKPTTKSQHKSFGIVYYHHGSNDKALEHFSKTIADNAVNYYIGRIYYNRGNHSLSLRYLARSNWLAAYYYRGRVYETLDQYKRAIAIYDSLQTINRKSDYAIRALKRKAFLYEDIGDTLQAVQTFLAINDRNTRFRAAMQLFKIGDLVKADSILRVSTEPEFIYWRIRIEERLNQSTEDLKGYLAAKHPLSYYNLVRNGNDLIFDTLSLDKWMGIFEDSTTSFSHTDSQHMANAVRYFKLNEMTFGMKELDMVEDKSPHDLLHLSKLCAQYGADRYSILFSLRVKEAAKQRDIMVWSYELYKLMYPVRYTFTIMDQHIDLGLCLAMIWQESLFDPDAISSANARGIMQIIPPTAKAIAKDLQVETYSLHDPSTSIKFGCYYFNNLLRDFKSVPLSLAGYNAGPVRVKRWIKQDPNYEMDVFIDLIPYNETRNYIKLILSRKKIYSELMKG
ncbi:MAG: transglycosylase SLT domain-containing protein [bacterium]